MAEYQHTTPLKHNGTSESAVLESLRGPPPNSVQDVMESDDVWCQESHDSNVRISDEEDGNIACYP